MSESFCIITMICDLCYGINGTWILCDGAGPLLVSYFRTYVCFSILCVALHIIPVLFPATTFLSDCFPSETTLRLFFSARLALHLFVFCSFSGDAFECSCALILTLFNADILNMGFMQCHRYLIATKQPVDNNRLCLSCHFAFKKHFLFRRSF